MIKYENFLQCHLDFYSEFRKAERFLQARKDDLIRSTNSLICHSETSELFKSQLLKFKRDLT